MGVDFTTIEKAKLDNFSLIIDKLYKFHFKNYSGQVFVYLLSFIIAFAYMMISGVILSRPQQNTIVEGLLIGGVFLVGLPLLYALKSDKLESNVTEKEQIIIEESSNFEEVPNIKEIMKTLYERLYIKPASIRFTSPTNSDIRKWYKKQLAQIPELDEQWKAQGLSLKERARAAWKIRHFSRLAAREMMSSSVDRELLRARDISLYGNPDGKDFNYIVKELLDQGIKGADLYEAIIKGEKIPETKQIAIAMGEIDKIIEKYNPNPKITSLKDEILINDFPSQPLLAKAVNGKESQVFEGIGEMKD